MMKGRLRWFVIGLIALAAIINYIDRQSINVLWYKNIGPDLFPEMDDDGLNYFFLCSWPGNIW